MNDVATRARALFGRRSGPGAPATGAESTTSRTGPPCQRDVEAIARQLQLAGEQSGGAPVSGGAAQPDRLAAALVEQAKKAVEALDAGASAGSLSDDQVIAIESVIRTRGRPALIVEDGELEALDDDRHPGSGFWRIPVNDHEVQLLRVASATGAVMVRDRQLGGPFIVCGTAWRVAPDLVVTNRHVLLPKIGTRLVTRSAQNATEGQLKPELEVIVDFAHEEHSQRDARVVVTGVPFVAPDADPIDVAIIRITAAPPEITSLQLASGAEVSRQLFLVGHPGLLAAVPADVQAVFGTPNGRKRVCFGEKLADATAPAGELTHDASTIGGFSGACVLAFGGTGVSALHYYGDPVRGNRAITADALRAHAAARLF